ncbi:hypothetical protein BOX15_Mlig006324g1 [Macrostomum lignano]|uniref:HMG box domain-containing protein n=1 Tax=Macrostomum lignano TaxID=282301 RepID=A0A267E543_9PLAT|nr:hypothetical protein BOX15_Mlig006324g1 [Macrostomum lignano]
MLGVEPTSRYSNSNNNNSSGSNSSNTDRDGSGISYSAALFDSNWPKEPAVHMDYYSAYSRGQQAWGGSHYPNAYHRDQHPSQQQHLQHQQQQLACYPASQQAVAATPQFPPASAIIELPEIGGGIGQQVGLVNNSSGGSAGGSGGTDAPGGGGGMDDGSCVKHQQLHHHLHHQQHLLRHGAGSGAPAGSGGVAKLKKPKKKKKRDPHEPQKPVSAYAMFFRDTQSKIKAKKPDASFGEISKLVASMWDNLDQEDKNDYKKRTETAKKEYLRKLAAYKARMVSMETPLGYGNATTYIDLGYYQQPGFAQRHSYYQQQQQQPQHQHPQPHQQSHISQPQQQPQHPAVMANQHHSAYSYHHQQHHQHLQHQQAMQQHQQQMHQAMMYYPNPVASPTDTGAGMMAGEDLNQQQHLQQQQARNHYPAVGGHCGYSAQLQQHHMQHQQHPIQMHHQQQHLQQHHGYGQQQQHQQLDASGYQQGQQAASIPSPTASADTPSGDSSSNCQATPQAASSPASTIMHHQQQQQQQGLATPTGIGGTTWCQPLKKADDAYPAPVGGEDGGGAAQLRDMYAYWMGRQEAPAAQDSFSEAVM